MLAEILINTVRNPETVKPHRWQDATKMKPVEGEYVIQVRKPIRIPSSGEMR